MAVLRTVNSLIDGGGVATPQRPATPTLPPVTPPAPPAATDFTASDGSKWSTAEMRDARNLQLAEQGFVVAQQQMQQQRGRDAASASLSGWLQTFFDPTKDAATINQLMTFINQQLTADIPPDAIMISIRQQPFYKERFKGNDALRDAGIAELTPAEYLQTEQTYSSILTSANLGDLATRQNFASMIGGQVSAVELQDRVTNVYQRIQYADTALKEEMKRLKQLGNIDASDFAQALLTGKEGAASLRRKIATAEVSTEFTQRGMQSALGATELANLGVTRQQAQTGAEYARAGTQRLGELAAIYGADQTNIQAELESEAFKGLESQRRKRLTAMERSAFSGSSGMGQPSLGRSAAGNI